MKKCLIIANGKSPTLKVVNYFIKKGFNTIICADGGANSARKLNLLPDYIIGDLDSISKENLKHFSKITSVLKYERQNDTDVEKCLKFAIKNKFTQAVLLGVTGDRLDHTICNLGIVLKFIKKIKILISAEKSLLIPVEKSISFSSIKGETISIYAFNNQTKISSAGLKYKLYKTALPFGVRESTSNLSTNDIVTIKVENGAAFIIRELQTIIKYDLFQSF